MITLSDKSFDAITLKNVQQWLQGNYDPSTKLALQKLILENPKEVTDAFYTNLTFGTGGMRGIMGIGTNRFNIYTVRGATQGLANYIKKQPVKGSHAVAIGYDSRINSRLFAEEAAKVLAANGIEAHLFAALRPTPLISFACRALHCTSALMITASHNPPEYNGYKVYWNDGAQVLPPHDKGIMAEVRAISDLAAIKTAPIDHPLIQLIGPAMDDAYFTSIDQLQHYPDINREEGHKLKVIYTSLHGTGITMVPKALQHWGFTNCIPVKAQEKPDGNFPTTPSPNPEERAALKLGIESLQKESGDLLVATDPDCDRMGVALLHHGEVVLLNGNQIASLCLEHICNALTTQKRMPAKAAFIKTIVTTELFHAIATSYGKPCFDVLTGFKYITEKIRQWEDDPNGFQFIFGGEESYGYLLGTSVRDKDAISASALICEVALQSKLQGKTLVDELHAIYRKYGLYREKLLSLKYEEGKAGREKMTKAMTDLYAAPPKEINGTPVIEIQDHRPIADVIAFRLADGSKVVVRPSGTEPKIKLYGSASLKSFSSIDEASLLCDQRLTDLLNALQKRMN